jgi:hypothetical protein
MGSFLERPMGLAPARIEAFKRAKEPDRLQRRQPRREASFSSRGVGRAALPSRVTPPRVPHNPNTSHPITLVAASRRDAGHPSR